MSDTNKAPGEFNPVKRNESLPVIKWEDFDRIGKEKNRRIKKQGAEESDALPDIHDLSIIPNFVHTPWFRVRLSNAKGSSKKFGIGSYFKCEG